MAVNYNLREVTCQKPVDRSNFGQGTQDYIFSLGTPDVWCPAKSYFKFDMQIVGNGVTVGGVTAPVIPRVSDGLAFADNVCGNLYTNCFMKFEGQDVSSITSFVPQTSALKKRLFKSHGWLGTIGKDACGDLASQLSRCYLASAQVPGDNDNGDTAISFKGRLDADFALAAVTVATVTGPPPVTTVTQVATGTAVNWTLAGANQIFVGDIIVINGVKCVVATVAAGALTVSGFAGQADIAGGGTFNYYFLRQNTQRTNTSKNIISVLWQPPLGIMDYKDYLGSGNYKFSLTPDSNFLFNAVETKNPNYNAVPFASLPGAVPSFNFVITDVKLYVYQAKMSIPEGPQTLDLMETLVMNKPISNNTGNGNYQFSVPPSTSYITIFAQDGRVGSSASLSPSLFKCSQATTALTPGDMTLTNIQCIYSSITKPSTNWSSAFTVNPNALAGTTSQTNQMVQRFYDSFLEFQNSANSNFGTETFNEWAQRGPFYMFVYARDQSDRSTEVQLNATFSDILVPNSNIFICAWYHNTVQYTVNNGMITALSSRQV